MPHLFSSLTRYIFVVFAELFPPPDVHSTMSDTLATSNAAAATSNMTSSQSCHDSSTFGMKSMVPINNAFLSRDDMKNTSSGTPITDDQDNENLFLWKFDLFDNNIISNHEARLAKPDRDSLRNVELVRFWGSRIRRASAMSEIAFNLRKNIVTRPQEHECGLDASTVVFVLGVLGSGVFICRRFFG